MRTLKGLGMALCLMAMSLMVTGCQGLGGGPAKPLTADQITAKTIMASQEAMDLAMKAYYTRYAMAEVSNEKTRATDPGGYLERKQKQLLAHGKVTDALIQYQLATNAAIDAWVLAGRGTRATAPITPAVLEAEKSLQEVIQ